MEQEIKENLIKVLLTFTTLIIIFLLLVILVAIEVKTDIFSAFSDVISSLETFNFRSSYGPLVLFFSLFLGGLATYILEFTITILRKGVGGVIYMRQFVNTKDHYVILGGGRIGKRIAEDLSNAGQKCIVVEKDENRATELKQMKFKVFIGDGTTEKVLKMVNVGKAKGVFCCFGEDVSNLVAAINVKEINKDVPVISRCNSPSNVPKFKAFGVESIIMPEIVGADTMFNQMKKLKNK